MVFADALGWLLAYCLTVFVVTTGKLGPRHHFREVVKEGNHTKVPASPNLTELLRPALILAIVYPRAEQAIFFSDLPVEL